MPLEVFTNTPATSVTSGATTTPAAGTSETWTVASSALFPAASSSATPPTQFRIRVENELCIVTNVSGTTWTVTRGAESSTVASHANGTEVRLVVTAAVLGGFGANLEMLVASSTADADVKARADYVCGTLNAEAQINAAITAVNAAGGGVVRLTAGTFNIGNFNTNGIRMRRTVELIGAGRESTFLVAGGTWAGHDAIAQGGCIEPVDNTQDRWAVRRLTITSVWGDHDVRGIYFNISSNTGFVYGDDSMIVLESLYIRGMKRAGIDGRGAYSRKNTIIDVQMFDMGDATFVVDGIYWDSNDSHFFGLDVGDCTGYGINCNGPNNRFVASKAWFSGLSGWLISGVRNQLSACEAQDNLRHGFEITGQWNTLASCMADSNSYDKSPSGAITGRTYHGFRVASNFTTLAACTAKDKNEGARGLRQVYGYYLDTAVKDCQVIGIAWQNWGNATALDGLVGGPAINGTYNNIQVTGQDSFATDANFVRFVGSAMGSEITFWRSEQTAAVAAMGLDLVVAKTELDVTQQSTRKRVDPLDVGSTLQLAVTLRAMQATADTVTVTICDAATPTNVLATCVCTVAAAIATTPYLGTAAAKPSWYTTTTNLAVFVSHTGAATLDYIFKDVTLRQRP